MKDQIEGDNIFDDDSNISQESEEKMTHLIEKADEISNKVRGIDFTKLARLQEESTFDNAKFASMIEHTLISLNQFMEDVGKKAIEAAQVLLDTFSKFNYSIFDRIQESLSRVGNEFEIYFDNLEATYQNELYEARWFPHAINTDNLQLFLDVSEVLEHTRRSKNRTKKLDQIFFDFYNKKRLDEMKRDWRKNTEIPVYIQKMLLQAVNAYNRKEYALTNSVLMTLWEGIIASKVGKENNYRTSGATRQSLETLNDENNNGETIKSFCSDFIFYDCRQIDEVKEDVPGRHGIAHSWYIKYPSRKTALNAIIFTDFLLSLKPIIQE